jgi:hypothetical protein
MNKQLSCEPGSSSNRQFYVSATTFKPHGPPVGKIVSKNGMWCAVERGMNAIEHTTEDNRFNLTRGILGALLGAGVGAGAMFAFYALAGFRFPLLGVGIGVLTGYGAKVLFKGSDTTLGYISAAIALATVVATLFLMYGTFPLVSIISVIISASVAYRIASR